MNLDRLPPHAAEVLNYLLEQGFVADAPSADAMRLRELACGYVDAMVKGPAVLAVYLCGSAVVGNADALSDANLRVVTDGPVGPGRTYALRGKTIDLGIVSVEYWEKRVVHGDDGWILACAVPVYARSAELAVKQRYAIEEYYSRDAIAARRNRVAAMAQERLAAGTRLREAGCLALAAVCHASACLAAVDFLVYRYRGLSSPLARLGELKRIGAGLDHPDWHERLGSSLHMALPAARIQELLVLVGTLYEVVRERLAKYPVIRQQLRSLGPAAFAGAWNVEEACSEAAFQQLRDRLGRASGRGQVLEAGLMFADLANRDFQRFSPLFYLKNVDWTAGGGSMAELPLEVMYDAWDEEAKELWKAVSRVDMVAARDLQELKAMAEEVLGCCS